MFDLESLTRKKSETAVSGHETTLFYQTDACRQLLEETMRFEGMGLPAIRPCTDLSIVDDVADVESQLILIEIKSDLVNIAHRLSPLVSKYARVVLIGHEDKISVLRSVKEMGFYYLFWPIDKSEVAVFLHFLQKDQAQDKGPQDARIARRIGVVGLKGGSGCTMISSQLAHFLAEDTRQQVILVDHAYRRSNMHIMLGKRDLTRRPVGEFASAGGAYGAPVEIDRMEAQGQLTKVDNNISYLGLSADIGSGEQLRQHTARVLEALQKDANFFIEDYSASAKFYPEPEWLCEQVSCLVLVLQPTLSSLHEAKGFLEEFKRANSMTEKPVRLLLVMNHCYSKDTIDRKAMEQYLQLTIDIELPYYRYCEDFLSSGKRFSTTRTPLQKPLDTLTRLILGKPLAKGGSIFPDLFAGTKDKGGAEKKTAGKKTSLKPLGRKKPVQDKA